jgi:hypothetical protein
MYNFPKHSELNWKQKREFSIHLINVAVNKNELKKIVIYNLFFESVNQLLALAPKCAASLRLNMNRKPRMSHTQTRQVSTLTRP